MQVQEPCEQFGTERSEQIDALIEAATGRPCPGRSGGRCALAPMPCEVEAPHLAVIAS